MELQEGWESVICSVAGFPPYPPPGHATRSTSLQAGVYTATPAAGELLQGGGWRRNTGTQEHRNSRMITDFDYETILPDVTQVIQFIH